MEREMIWTITAISCIPVLRGDWLSAQYNKPYHIYLENFPADSVVNVRLINMKDSNMEEMDGHISIDSAVGSR